MPATVASIREHLISTRRIVAYYPLLAEIGGGVTPGIFLSQSLYWTERAKSDGWFYKRREEWETETGLSRWGQETARRDLRDRGLLHERRAGNPNRLFFRVDLDRLAAAVNERLGTVSSSPLVGIPPEEVPPVENPPAGKPPTAQSPAENHLTSRLDITQQFGGKPASLMEGNHPANTPKTTTDHAKTTAETSETEREKSPSAKNLASLLKAEILNNKPDYRLTPKQLRDWQTTADRMIRLDNRTEVQIAAVIRWTQADSFWKTTALSMDSIRKHFDQLELKARGQTAPVGHTGTGEVANGRRRRNGIGADRNLDRYTKGLPGAIVAGGDEEKAQ